MSVVSNCCRELKPLLHASHNEKMYEFASGLYFVAADVDISETEFPAKNPRKTIDKSSGDMYILMCDDM